jgi:pimeloyl-ACP methyl ester carboxylesterase
MASHLVIFSHGKESGPWGSKIVQLADTANNKGYQVDSIDYQGINDVNQRVDKLLQAIPANGQKVVLVGSSMGAYVSIMAAQQRAVAGLFLLAPAVYLPGYPNTNPQSITGHIEVVHGWNDTIVPVENAIRFAREHQASCHLFNDEHRLMATLNDIDRLFMRFLDKLAT